jgi:ADP-heptose:LPS heptosyltransferase
MSLNTNSNASQLRQPIKCLLLQLGGSGDLYKSLMALKAAKQLYPQLEITVLCKDKFSEGPKCISWIREVVVFKDANLTEPYLQGKAGRIETLDGLREWINPLLKQDFDFVLNWSFSEASSYLAQMIPSEYKLGYVRNFEGQLCAFDQWSQYFQGVLQNNIDQNIHVTDILTTQFLTALHLFAGAPSPPVEPQVSHRSFFVCKTTDLGEASKMRDGGRFWISLQLDADSGRPEIPLRVWSSLASQILRRHPEYHVALLGGSAKQRQAEKILQSLLESDKIEPHRILNLADCTFDQNICAISNSRWVVSADHAVAHLATLLGTRVLQIGLGDVRAKKVLEAAPYGNQHGVILPVGQSPMVQHEYLAGLADIAYGTWSYLQSQWSHQGKKTIEDHFSQLGLSPLPRLFQAYVSKIRLPEDGGGSVYEGLFNRALDLEEWVSMANGYCARSWFCGWAPPIGKDFERRDVSVELIRDLRKLKEATEVLHKVCLEAKKTSKDLLDISKGLVSDRLMDTSVRAEIATLGIKLKDLEILIDRLSVAQKPLNFFRAISKVFLHNMSGSKIREMSKESFDVFSRLEQGVQNYLSWIDFSQKLGRPVVVSLQVKEDGALREIKEFPNA